MRKFLVLAGLLVLLAGCGEEKKRGKQRLANTKKMIP
ncbi:lipoprotein [Campylobacter sp. JMF_08 NE1]|nr:lipoprotein [Campylobacter sp. JMF_08 NE1]MDA3047826.1 lipoprotein [Campylobacter sp. JMF_08 NE1]